MVKIWQHHSLYGMSNGAALYFSIVGYATACNESYREFVYLD